MTQLLYRVFNPYSTRNSQSKVKIKENRQTSQLEDITDVINKYEKKFQWSEDEAHLHGFSRIVVR